MSTRSLQEHFSDLFQKMNFVPTQSNRCNSSNVFNQIESPQLRQWVHEQLEPCPEDIRLRIQSEFFACGPLDRLLNDDAITEIIINSESNIWYERHGHLHRHDDHFLSEITFNNFVHRICSETHSHLNFKTPFNSCAWQGFRVQMSHPPITKSITICLRRKNQKALSSDYLLASRWCDDRQWTWLQSAIKQKKNLVIFGGTGCGKTTALNCLTQQLPHNERVVFIEDTDELLTPNGCSVKTLTRSDMDDPGRAVQQQDLVIQSLRMRPDRIILGEVRGPEAKDFLMAASTGHPGSMTTLHADSPQQALWRLEMLVLLGAPQWHIHAIRKLIQLSVQYMVEISKKDGKRYLKDIYKVQALEGNGFTLDSIENLHFEEGLESNPL